MPEQNLLSKEHTQLWAQYSQQRDKQSRDALVLAHLPLVHKVVRKMTSHWNGPVNTDDLIGMGTLGLIDAVTRFDPLRGFEFNTFATHRIRGAVLDGLRSLDWVPRSLRAKAKEIEAAYAEVEHQTLRSAKDEEIAERIGVSIAEFQSVLYELSVSPLVSLDGMLANEDPGSDFKVSDTIMDPNAPQPDSELERADVQAILSAVLDRLPEKERLVVTLHYYEEFTFKEIAEIVELSSSRVSQLHTKAIYRLRGALSRRKKELRA
ncbi:sigma-70 family RNA polymerase sigma factor [Tumebacillus permanentifrigoris]|uniref:RNA polymerase sigma-28 (SigD/FliA/WhiG) subunit n=1 Tax=Tumebacillus permanentifrigoris TaxID=378543 RepID=A0A316D7N3_9BACL|nr:FliA/WhiG family RNA polymerase sigma factor [Tumebacillus permanentifrigoris]PWK12686.1 RNA polymerase sigma-28 (SigD/FliA/WhiG) subunit [Tumebacillus permanentifrigoris]